ncbi:hypothetical protein N9118_12710 [Akkermansiaceae bacterium]|nr:hypothetical protein [Akkermansiaceae bacterium]
MINYQGRLADASGAPVTGSKNFTLSIYDGETEGSLLYSEDIGAVTLDDNGVYSFQFGESGTSQATATKSTPFLPHPIRSKGAFKALPLKANS